MPETKQITRDEYYQIIGLLSVAREWAARCTHIERMLNAITKEQAKFEGGGHCGDAIWSAYDADELLGKLGIEVADARD